jgi:dihydropteroate synthase
MTHQQLSIKLNNKLVDLSTPIVMGIINTTPDSFYKESRFTSEKSILSTVEKMLTDGASIIDVGGYSTRPNAEDISQEVEINRVSRALEVILKKFPDTLISLDTFRSAVARQISRNYPISIINDISGGILDDLMFETVADLKITYILTHTKGTPQNMQCNVEYEDVVAEVLNFLEKRVARLHLLGINDIIIDLGFGFAKTANHNFKLLKEMKIFKELNTPILTGISRKSMIYKTLNTTPENGLNGTTALNMLALLGGTSILRVHDVKEAMEVITLFNNYTQS